MPPPAKGYIEVLPTTGLEVFIRLDAITDCVQETIDGVPSVIINLVTGKAVVTAETYVAIMDKIGVAAFP